MKCWNPRSRLRISLQTSNGTTRPRRRIGPLLDYLAFTEKQPKCKKDLLVSVKPSAYRVVHGNFMKIPILLCALLITIPFLLRASTPEQEKAFVDKYKTAFEAKDTAALESFFYTEGADPAFLRFVKMTLSSTAGEKISKIELVDLTPEDAKKLAAPTDLPTGGKVCLKLKPTKKLVVTIEKKEASGRPTSSFVNVVSEKDGKLVIPIPGPCN
jgi:hypothetical protein